MKKLLLSMAACALLMSGALATGDEKADKPKIKLDGIKCPVSGGKVKEASFLAYKDAKVFFCCNNCPKAFAKDTPKFATKANHQLAATKQAKQLKCPLKGTNCKKAHAVEVAGVNVYFCCPGCKGKVAAAKGDDQLKLVFSEEAFKKAYSTKKKKKGKRGDD